VAARGSGPPQKRCSLYTGLSQHGGRQSRDRSVRAADAPGASRSAHHCNAVPTSSLWYTFNCLARHMAECKCMLGYSSCLVTHHDHPVLMPSKAQVISTQQAVSSRRVRNVCKKNNHSSCTPKHFNFDMLKQNLVQTFSQECRYLTPWGDTRLMNK